MICLFKSSLEPMIVNERERWVWLKHLFQEPHSSGQSLKQPFLIRQVNTRRSLNQNYVSEIKNKQWENSVHKSVKIYC